MKKIIFRKLSLDCISFFLLSLFSISIIIWVLQAVNYLDFITEDGHGFFVYLKYTLLSFPKILGRIFPFAIFFSITYILLKYEDKNELVIFWNYGIHKIKFVNFFIKLSILFLVFNLILNSVIVPTALNKSRSYIRTSNLDFFESMLKPRKFIDMVKNLTIFFDEKKANGDLKNIFLKNKSKDGGYQITFAKIGRFEMRGGKKILVLYDGKTLDGNNETLSEFKFQKTDFNISYMGENLISVQKTQENSTKQLVKCASILQKKKLTSENYRKIYLFTNCKFENLENIYKELYRRLILPFYIIILFMIPLLIITKSKEEESFKFHKFKVIIFGILFIVFMEASSIFIKSDLADNYLIIILPLLFYILFHFYLVKKFKYYTS